MREALGNAEDYPEFPYVPDSIKDYCSICNKVSKATLKRNGFAHRINADAFAGLLKNCSADNISSLRSLFMDLYRDEHYSQIMNDDLTALVSLRNSIDPLKEYEGYDNIQKMQIRWFIKNLSDIITAFEGQKAHMR